MTKVEFQKACLEAGIQLNEEQMNQFEKYMQLLIEWNEKMNLTAITAGRRSVGETFLRFNHAFFKY